MSCFFYAEFVTLTNMRLDTADLMELARFEVKSKNQPRVPAGSSHGGEFTSGGISRRQVVANRQALVDKRELKIGRQVVAPNSGSSSTIPRQQVVANRNYLQAKQIDKVVGNATVSKVEDHLTAMFNDPSPSAWGGSGFIQATIRSKFNLTHQQAKEIHRAWAEKRDKQ